jgi:hypothetical protein
LTLILPVRATFLEFVEQARELFRSVLHAEFGNLGARKFVAALVVGMTGVALEPTPPYFVASAEFIELTPQVVVFYRLPVGGLPVARFPGRNPGGDAVPLSISREWSETRASSPRCFPSP